MSAPNKEAAKQRTALLVQLRKQHADAVKAAQDRLKAQQATRKQLRDALQGGPGAVPQLAAATGLPAHEVLFYLAAMKKYGLVEEAGMDDEEAYYRYRLTQEAQP